MAGYKFSGQTEVLAALNNLKNSDIEMIFIYKNFCTLLATRHIAIKDVPEAFLKRFATALEHGVTAMQDLFAIKNPRIAVAGLNPHAGEGGLFGDEETKLEPVLNSLRQKYPQTHISDFMSADSLFAKAAQSLRGNCHPERSEVSPNGSLRRTAAKDDRIEAPPYDLYIAAYHDQALPLIKGVSGFDAVNLSYGLPYIRVSMDHGTGFDIAGKGIASQDGLIACLELLSKLNLLQNCLEQGLRVRVSGVDFIRQ
jgi:4-hydroxythreonine-4-phosphate dehydrogenase